MALSVLEEVWAYREEVLFPQHFGKMSRGIFPLDFDLFKDVFDVTEIDPRWLHLGVFEFEPSAERKSWLYVSSGCSTPWEQGIAEPESEYSWLGVEFTLETPYQADWAINVIRRIMAYQVLVCHGYFGDYPPLDYGDRVPAGGAIDGSAESALRFLAISQPANFPATMQLASGKFDLLHLVGITEAERDFAKQYETIELIKKLATCDAFPVTNPRRNGIAL